MMHFWLGFVAGFVGGFIALLVALARSSKWQDAQAARWDREAAARDMIEAENWEDCAR